MSALSQRFERLFDAIKYARLGILWQTIFSVFNEDATALSPNYHKTLYMKKIFGRNWKQTLSRFM